MKITSYAVSLTYSTEIDGGNYTFRLDVARPTACDLSELGKVVGNRLQKVLSLHSAPKTEVVETKKKTKRNGR